MIFRHLFVPVTSAFGVAKTHRVTMRIIAVNKSRS